MYGNGSEAIRIDAKGTPGADDNFVINNNNIFGNGLEESNIALDAGRRPIHWHAQRSEQLVGHASNGPGGDFTGSGNGISAGGIPVTITPLLTTYAVNSEIPYYGLASTASLRRSMPSISTLESMASAITIQHQATPFNQYRPNADVDINTTTDPGSGYDVTNTASGEWLRYTVTTATPAFTHSAHASKARPPAPSFITKSTALR